MNSGGLRLGGSQDSSLYIYIYIYIVTKSDV